MKQRQPARLDPVRLRRAWSRAAQALVDPALMAEVGFLKHVAGRLVERCTEIRFVPTHILELGCRSGETARLLRLQWPKAKLVSLSFAEGLPSQRGVKWAFWQRSTSVLVAEAANLPFKRNHFDLVISNMALHWTENPQAVLREMRRVLAPERPLLLSTVGAGTFQELRDCLEVLDQQHFGRIWSRVPNFPSLHQLGESMQSSGFVQSVVDRESIQARFPDPITLLQRLRRLGIGNHHRPRHTGLTGKQFPRQLARLYRQRYGPEQGDIGATVALLFAHAWKGGGENRS